LQQKILDFIWQEKEVTAEQVRQGLLSEHPLKDSSVRTLLHRLEQQGYLEHRLVGKTFIYRATAPTTSHAVNTVRQLIERFWSGSAEQFVAGMVDAKVLSAAELRRLAKKVKG
jgi:predicted transcriptional regulator